MPVTIFQRPSCDLTQQEVEAWRSVPVSVAVDLARDSGQIDPAVRPLLPAGQQPRLFGRAVTARCEPPDFGAVIHALDQVGRGDVLVIAAQGQSQFAMIGDVLGGYLRQRGCAGVVCDGAVRDVDTLAQWSDFAVFSRFITPRGPESAERGTVNEAVVIGGQQVRPGDVILGDGDGVVALRPAFVRTRIGDALAKLKREEEWTRHLSSGHSPVETFGLQPAQNGQSPE